MAQFELSGASRRTLHQGNKTGRGGYTYCLFPVSVIRNAIEEISVPPGSISLVRNSV